MDYSNHTLYGIHSAPERYLCLTLMSLVTLCCLVGDPLILVGSIKYNSFKLHGVLVAIIEHIAISNILLAVFANPTYIITLGYDRWVLGEVPCYSRVYSAYLSYTPGVLLVAVLALTKLLIIKFPLRARMWTKTQSHVMCGVIWGTCSLPVLAMLLSDGGDVAVDYRIYSCRYKFSHPVWSWLLPLISTIFLVIPNLVVMVCTVMLIVITFRLSRSMRRSVKWEGLLAIVVTGSVYCVSMAPLAASFLLERISVSGEVWLVVLHRVGLYSAAVNLSANFFIYSLTVVSFRDFVKGVLRRVTLGVSGCTPLTPPDTSM